MYIGQELPELTPVEIVGCEVCEAGSPLALDDGWFTKAIEDAEAVIADGNVLQKEIDEALEALQKAVKGLEDAKPVPSVDKEKLKQLIAKADGYLAEKEKYISATVTALMAAYENAEQVYDEPKATADEVKEAYNLLHKAIMGLREVPNKDKLEELLKSAMQIDLTSCSAETAAEVKAAIAMAKAVAASGTTKTGGKTPVKTGDRTKTAIPVIAGLAAVFVCLLLWKKRAK